MDIIGRSPYSRLSQSEFSDVDGVKQWLRDYLTSPLPPVAASQYPEVAHVFGPITPPVSPFIIFSTSFFVSSVFCMTDLQEVSVPRNGLPNFSDRHSHNEGGSLAAGPVFGASADLLTEFADPSLNNDEIV
jgi:hypothetical protein